jgi:hypothetical protein
MADAAEGPRESMVSSDMLERKGVWGESRSSYPVTATDIRRWAIAVYWPEQPPPIFWDEDYAATTRWGGIIAPQDFNPFAWPVERPGMGGPPRGARGGGGGGGGRHIMNGGLDSSSALVWSPFATDSGRAIRRLPHGLGLCGTHFRGRAPLLRKAIP